MKLSSSIDLTSKTDGDMMTCFTIKYLFKQGTTIAYGEKDIERGMGKLILHQFSLLKSLIRESGIV